MSAEGVHDASLLSDCTVHDPVEIVSYQAIKPKPRKREIQRRMHRRSTVTSLEYLTIYVQKAKHPMLADGWALKTGGKGDYIPVSFNGDALIRILRHSVCVEYGYGI